jgi:hypothetical protein
MIFMARASYQEFALGYKKPRILRGLSAFMGLAAVSALGVIP